MALELAAFIGSTAVVLEALWGMGTTLAQLPNVKDWAAGLHVRAAGRLALPANHTLVRTIRTAHLTAIDKITRRHADQLRRQNQVGDTDETAFNETIRSFLATRLKLLRDDTDFAAVTEAEVRHMLDELVHPSTIEGYAKAAATNRREAEARALAELEAHAGFPAPLLYRRLFIGEAAPGWYETFGLFVNEQIKSNEAFRSIFLAAELVDVKRLIAAMDARIAAALDRGVARLDGIATDSAQAARNSEEILHHQQRMPAEIVAQLMAAMEARGHVARAQEEGLERRTILALAKRLRNEDAPDLEQAIAALDQAVDIALAAIRRGEQASNEDAFVDRVLAQVARQTRDGAFDAAARMVDDGLAELDRREAEHRAYFQRSRTSLLEAGIAQDTLRRDAAAVARRIETLVALGEPDRPAWTPTFRSRWDAYYEEGQARGANFSLEVAIALALRMRATAAAAGERGAAGNLLGNALCTLGERESGTVRLEEAVAALRIALEEWTRARVPLEWALTQNNLGNALLAIGDRDRGTGRLEEAVTAYRLALQEQTRDRAPLDWAMTQNNLGNALRALGDRKSETECLEEAVAAYSLALQEWTRERVPLDWATAQNNLGTALRAIGERESGTRRLEEAVTAYRLALQERTQDRVPLDWAMTQNNLGNALATLGTRESGTRRLEEAVTAYRLALHVWTRDRVPPRWAMTLVNLALAEVSLGERQDTRAYWRSALRNVLAALEVFEESDVTRYAAKARTLRDDLLAHLAALLD